MVVVPTLAHSDERQPEIISAVVGSIKPSAAEQVSQGINGESSMIEKYRADESPHEHLRSGGTQLRCP